MEQENISMADFMAKHKIGMECVAGGIPPEDFKDSDPWVCKLYYDGRTMEMPFYTGKGHREFNPRAFYQAHRYKATDNDIYRLQMAGKYDFFKVVKPKVEDLLDCLASDCSGYDSSRCFEDWASDYGYDEDSRKAERVYSAIREERNKVEAFLGRETYNELLYKVERL